MVDPGVIGTALPRSERDILVHGTAAQAEFDKPGPPNEIEYRGWGAVVVAENQHAWVHLPIPIPIDIPAPIAIGGSTPFSDLARLVRLEVRYEVPPAGEVRNLHLWDADTRFFFWDFPDKRPAGPPVRQHRAEVARQSYARRQSGPLDRRDLPDRDRLAEPPSTFTLFSARAHLE